MTADGGVDYPRLRDLVEWHLAEGTHAIVAVGTTGESATLDFQEHIAVIAAVVEQVRGRVPVIAGTGANATAEAVILTHAAMEAKADAALLVTPYYNKPTQEGLFQHYATIADQCRVPIILYNVPGRTACDLLPETVARLAPQPNIVGIKEASGKVERVGEILHLCGEQLEVFSGDDGAALGALAAGARGIISVTANVAPRAMAELCEAALAGDFLRARAINAALIALHRDLFIESNPIPVKWALQEMGRIGPGLRLPLTALAPTYHERLRASLRQAHCL
jgi:4-hydroxy-tetrahydrodipicolinate synthase